MIKFFKEIISSIKEGIEEGKQELAEEKKNENESYTLKKIEIEKLPYTECFGNALGAPFRIVIFGDWFTLFNTIDEANNEYYPSHLYSFGSYKKLKDVKKEFITKLNRDFKITDQDSCLTVLSSFFKIANIKKENTIIENIDASEVTIPYTEMDELHKSAVISCIISYITTAATDVGYLKKAEALSILEKTIEYVKNHHNNWNDYGNYFIEGQSEIGLNNLAGNKVLKKYLNYLKTKKGSPWNNLTW